MDSSIRWHGLYHLYFMGGGKCVKSFGILPCSRNLNTDRFFCLNLSFRSLLQVTGYTFRGSNSAIFIIVSFVSGVQLIKENICSLQSKFFLILYYTEHTPSNYWFY